MTWEKDEIRAQANKIKLLEVKIKSLKAKSRATLADQLIIRKATKGFTVTQGDDVFAFTTLLDAAKELVKFLEFDAYSAVTVTAERKESDRTK